MKIILKTFITLIFLSLALHAQSPSKAVLINKMIEVYGGEKNLAQLNNYEQVWHIETKTSDTNGTDKREVHLPIFLKTELIYPQKSEIRILINDYGTKQFGQEKIQAKGPMLDAMKAQLIRLFHPLILKEKIADITASETPEYYLLAITANSVTAEYFVSKKSYLIEKVIGRLQMGPQNMEFLTLYEDYKPINGVMVPHTEIKYAGSVNTAVMRLQEMKLTPSVQSHR